MGIFFGKQSNKGAKSENINLHNAQTTQQQEAYEIYDPNKYDEETVEILKLEFKKDPEMFILNLLLMSIMFFDDFQEEIRILANTVSERGQKLNCELIKEHQKQILMPDSILQSVDRRVKFKPPRATKTDALEPLTSQRMYILHDTIEIEDKKDSVDYSRIDKPCYRAEIEESKEHKGFIKVNLLGTAGIDLRSNKRESSDSASSLSSAKSDQKGIGTDSGFNTESDYDYTLITSAKTPRRIQISEKDIYSDISRLPSKCITKLKVKNEHISDSDSEDEDDENPVHRGSPSLFIINYYLNSIEFMSHFKNNVFPNHLAEILNFEEESVQKATSNYGSIFCDASDDFDNVINYEILPAIAMPWPDTIAFEWPLRNRVTVLDKRQKKPIAYKWPTDKMIEEAKKLNCVIVPKGFMPKKRSNPNLSIEWEIDFPKAERYLEFRMSHGQTRVFLIIITLYKVFIEPKTQNYGLLTEHIRNLMFWECEANYKAWPEDKMGIKLKLVLKTLYNYLSKNHLPHYFIRGKNLLENVPGKYIVSTLEIIQNILEFPLMHLMFALKHLKYTHGKFYPEINFDELYNIITKENVYSEEIIRSMRPTEETRRRTEDSSKKRKRDKERDWERRFLREQRQSYAKQLLQNHQENDKNLKVEPKDFSRSSDFKVPIKQHFNENTARQILLLTFFIQHFLHIAKKSFKISSTNQTLFYLKQAWYLTKLLESTDIENAILFQDIIRQEEENCHKKKIGETRIPTTPKRNLSYTFERSEILQFKGKEINMTNLNKSYNDQPRPSTSGFKKKTKKSNQKQIRADVHVLNKTPTRPIKSPKETRKSVSFNTLNNHSDISEDEVEITTL